MRDFFDQLNNELGVENKETPNFHITPKEKYTPIVHKIPDHREIHTPWSLKEKLITNFPETNFYLPNLRDKSTRILPIWGNSEKWKNMVMIQEWDDIILINAWTWKAERWMLWAKYSLPDISFLIPIKKKVKWIFISNIHDHNFGGLIEILSNLNKPTIYTNSFTADTLKKALSQNNMQNSCKIKELKDGEKVNVWKFNVKNIETYSSAPQNSCFVVKSTSSKILFTSDINAEKALEKLKNEKHITALISDSHSSNKKWNLRKHSEVKNYLEKNIKNDSEGKTIILLDPSIVKRVETVINIFTKHNKKIFFASKDIQEIYKTAEDKKIVKNTPSNLKRIAGHNINNIPESDKVFIVTGGIENEKSTINKIIDWTHNYISLNKWDKIILPASFVFPEKRDIENSINKLISEWIQVVACNYLDKDSDTHSFADDLKMLAKELKPKYVIPTSWDWILRSIHKNIVLWLGYKDIQVPLLNNWEMVDIDLKTNIFKSNIKAPIQDIIADWFWIWVANSHVIKARKQMMNSGVLVIVFNINSEDRQILWPIRLETRGLVYLEEVRQIHRIMIKKARAIYENTVADVPEIENKDLTKIIKTDLENYIKKAIDREPMIIPVMLEL